ncbi:sensor histidine kinase [Kocuria sp. cx-455]|uniref:sensor histidine kinase n=1 Tax=Kocuria sp. cx-455 TaxID=2771377 RepID=UPI003D71F343
MTPTPSAVGMLRVLRVSLHVSFAGLLAFGVLRVLTSDTDKAALACFIAAVLAGVYLMGTVWENRHAHGRSRDPRPYALPWLSVIFVLWAALVLLSADFSAVAFPLFFLYAHLLPRSIGVLSVVALTGFVVLSQWLHAGPRSFVPAMVFGPVLGMVFALVVASSYRAMYRDVQAYRHILQNLEATRSELARTERAAGQAAERERLSRDIHDTLAQGLSSIVLMSRAARESLAAGAVSVTEEQLTIIETTASENLSEARRFVKDLSSPALNISLEDGLRHLTEQTSSEARARREPLRVDFQCDGEGVAAPVQQTVILRAAQSLLSNVSRHAHAQQAMVSLSWWDREVSMDVVDDGVGFHPGRVPLGHDDHGFGLPGLRERVSAAGGTVTVESAPGDGTAVTVRLPLKPPGPGTRSTSEISSRQTNAPQRSAPDKFSGERA